MDYNSLSTRFACPFRLYTKTYSRKNELKVHVAKARLKKGDDCHPENDHLWDNPYVQSLLVFGTHARTPAEKRQKRQERNKRYRRKNEWRQNLKVFSANTSGVCPFYKYWLQQLTILSNWRNASILTKNCMPSSMLCTLLIRTELGPSTFFENYNKKKYQSGSVLECWTRYSPIICSHLLNKKLSRHLQIQFGSEISCRTRNSIPKNFNF